MFSTAGIVANYAIADGAPNLKGMDAYEANRVRFLNGNVPLRSVGQRCSRCVAGIPCRYMVCSMLWQAASDGCLARARLKGDSAFWRQWCSSSARNFRIRSSTMRKAMCGVRCVLWCPCACVCGSWRTWSGIWGVSSIYNTRLPVARIWQHNSIQYIAVAHIVRHTNSPHGLRA